MSSRTPALSRRKRSQGKRVGTSAPAWDRKLDREQKASLNQPKKISIASDTPKKWNTSHMGPLGGERRSQICCYWKERSKCLHEKKPGKQNQGRRKKEKPSKIIPKSERNIRKGFLHWKLAVAQRLINGHLGHNLFPCLLQFSTDALNDSIHCFRCKPHLPSEDQTPQTVRWRIFESAKLSTA